MGDFGLAFRHFWPFFTFLIGGFRFSAVINDDGYTTTPISPLIAGKQEQGKSFSRDTHQREIQFHFPVLLLRRNPGGVAEQHAAPWIGAHTRHEGHAAPSIGARMRLEGRARTPTASLGLWCKWVVSTPP